MHLLEVIIANLRKGYPNSLRNTSVVLSIIGPTSLLFQGRI